MITGKIKAMKITFYCTSVMMDKVAILCWDSLHRRGPKGSCLFCGRTHQGSMCLVDCCLVDSSGPLSAKAWLLHGAPLSLPFNLGRLATPRRQEHQCRRGAAGYKLAIWPTQNMKADFSNSASAHSVTPLLIGMDVPTGPGWGINSLNKYQLWTRFSLFTMVLLCSKMFLFSA